MKNLQIIRKKNNMSQIALAMKLEIAQETVSAYERGKSYPCVEILISMSKIFHVSTDYLLDLTDEERPADQLPPDNISPQGRELLALFEQLTPFLQHRVIGYVECLLDNKHKL